ncbi:hypothetical protein RRG08_008567 [Elysia crispata]|uniref:Uncharacterized protein n=1 Tax=Elysia crispata TaxID=231223 RepID=A0AAE0Y137_9GAST|nr:hypothetical protein RRG08_008567 [Elysia crispata]
MVSNKGWESGWRNGMKAKASCTDPSEIIRACSIWMGAPTFGPARLGKPYHPARFVACPESECYSNYYAPTRPFYTHIWV